jgi:TPR repeat protein
MALLEKAAGQGHAYAMQALGCIHLARNANEQALTWFTKGAEAGLPKAMFNAGQGLTLVHFSAQRKRFLWIGGRA